jgi:hypothetical protein
MKKVVTDNQLIELFLLGKLTDSEIRSFKDRLENDREFRRKHRLIKTFPEMMSEEGKKEFERQQSVTLVQKPKKKSGNITKKKLFIWTAISIPVIIGASLFFIFYGTHHKNEFVSFKGNSTPEINTSKSTTFPVKDVKADTKRKPEATEVTIVQKKPDSEAFSSAIELILPADGEKFTKAEMLKFRWNMRTDTFTRFYIISEKFNKVVLWKGIRPGIREHTIPGNYLYPGKFFWYVGTKDQKRTFIIGE